jgi:hypothetical protein
LPHMDNGLSGTSGLWGLYIYDLMLFNPCLHGSGGSPISFLSRPHGLEHLALSLQAPSYPPQHILFIYTCLFTSAFTSFASDVQPLACLHPVIILLPLRMTKPPQFACSDDICHAVFP